MHASTATIRSPASEPWPPANRIGGDADKVEDPALVLSINIRPE